MRLAWALGFTPGSAECRRISGCLVCRGAPAARTTTVRVPLVAVSASTQKRPGPSHDSSGRAIPACAGLETLLALDRSQTPGHPRMCGARNPTCAQPKVNTGSSPHTRGSNKMIISGRPYRSGGDAVVRRPTTALPHGCTAPPLHCLPTQMPNCLPTQIPTCLPTQMPNCLPNRIPKYPRRRPLAVYPGLAVVVSALGQGREGVRDE